MPSPSPSPSRDVARLAEAVEDLRAVLAWPDDRLYLRVDEVSHWSAAQHVQHALLAASRILHAIDLLREGTDPRLDPPAGPTWQGRLVHWLRWIPRGRGRAPEEVRPDARPVRHGMVETALDVARRTAALAPAAADLRQAAATLPHPALGPFTALLWLRFAATHTRHHLAVIADIDRHRAVGAPATEAPTEASSDEPAVEPS